MKKGACTEPGTFYGHLFLREPLIFITSKYGSENFSDQGSTFGFRPQAGFIFAFRARKFLARQKILSGRSGSRGLDENPDL